MNIFRTDTTTNKTTVTGLAVVGFIALVAAGMWLAVYSTRFVPPVVNRIGTAAVYLGSLFTPAPGISVVPTPVASTTIFFGGATSQPSPEATAGTATSTTLPKSSATTAGEKTDTTYQISGTSGTPTLSGLPDLVVKITAVGYLTTTSADSFVMSASVPAGNRPAVSFTIKNIGTNATGSWRFSVSIPTQTAFAYQSQPQQSLNPGDSIDYTLGFDQASNGMNETISITANFDHAFMELTTDNNSDSAVVTILGS